LGYFNTSREDHQDFVAFASLCFGDQLSD